MKLKSTPSFIYQISLKPEKWQKDIIEHRIDVGRQIYNACLNELYHRHNNMINSNDYKTLIIEYKIIKKNKKEDKLIEIRKQFNHLLKTYLLTSFDIQTFATKHAKTQFQKLVDSDSIQKVAIRAYNSVMSYHYHLRGKPRYKSYGQFKSMEGKTNKSSIRFKNDTMIWGNLKVKLDNNGDKYDIEALTNPVKYCRIVVKSIRNKPRYFLQLILEGILPKKYIISNDVIGKKIGIDLGPQSIAYVSDTKAKLMVLAEKVDIIKGYRKNLQRLMARKLRMNNPQNYEQNTSKLGKMKQKKDRKEWIKSKAYMSTKNKVKEISRKEKDYRKNSHNALINHLLTLGTEFYLEKINYVAWQKMFGKSIGNRAVGLFVEQLCHKASNAGGNVYEFNTHTTRLSQTCLCGTIKKKPLSLRWHTCDCGITVQRDVFSAYLAKFVNPKTSMLDFEAANNQFLGVKHCLKFAVQYLINVNTLEVIPTMSKLKVLGLSKSEIELLAD